MEKFFPADKIVFTGNPVREDLKNVATKRLEGLNYFNLDVKKKTILVIGGSLGARTINLCIEKAINKFGDKNVQLVWQTGRAFAARAKQIIEELKIQGVFSFDFIQRMDYAYAVADVIISRAGASSISELAIIGKPAILVPSPNVAEDHQTKNAMSLVQMKAALMVTDIEAPHMLISKTFDLLHDEGLQDSLSENIKKLAVTDADEKIASEIYKLAEVKQ
jgi:UDP-N-acetylglucosamine--N-acetylmuramyl-(pentapeptide) pyrophosphoryl-undecaprenol N-acetylglucosamine transferase